MKLKVFYFLMFAAVLMCVQDSFAVLIELPSSSYQGGKWEGSITHTQDGFNTLIEFNVYDTQGGNEWVDAGYEAPGDGRYIYAYQIYNAASDTKDVGYFEIFGKAGNTLTGGEISGLDSEQDPTSSGQQQGIKPYQAGFNDTEKKVSWEFLDAGGDFGVVGQARHSYFLTFSSDQAPIAGAYEIKPPATDFPIPTPEPTTIALLGAGSLLLVRKPRNSV